MGTKIEWANRPGYKGEVWNPVVGCTRVSAGCDHCYASALHNRRYKANVRYATEAGDFPPMDEALPILRGMGSIDGPLLPCPPQYVGKCRECPQVESQPRLVVCRRLGEEKLP